MKTGDADKMPVLESGMVRIPTDLMEKLRENLRSTEGEAVATAPIAMLVRYLAARAAGLSQAEASKYLHRQNYKS